MYQNVLKKPINLEIRQEREKKFALDSCRVAHLTSTVLTYMIHLIRTSCEKHRKSEAPLAPCVNDYLLTAETLSGFFICTGVHMYNA